MFGKYLQLKDLDKQLGVGTLLWANNFLGNINRSRLIFIDFGFFFLSSPGKKSGFESAPFKLTRDFAGLMDGPKSRTFKKFRELCYKTILELRKKKNTLK